MEEVEGKVEVAAPSSAPMFAIVAKTGARLNAKQKVTATATDGETASFIYL